VRGQEACGEGEGLVKLLYGSKGDDVGGREYAPLGRGESGFLPAVGRTRGGEVGMRRGGLGVTSGEAGQDGFGALRYYIDVRQCKGADYLAEESGFLVVRFDER